MSPIRQGSALAPFVVDTHGYTLTHTAADCAEHLAAQGCRAVEFLLAPGHLWPSELDAAARQALRRRLGDAGIDAIALNIPNFDVNLGSDYPEMRAYTLDLLEAGVRLAGELGAVAFAIGPGRSSPLFPASRDTLLGRLRSGLDRLVPAGRSSGVTLAIENVPYSFLPKTDALLDVLDEYGQDVGFTLDVANSHFVGEDMPDAVRRGAARLVLVHISDTGRQVHRHDRVGAGDVPFGALAPVLREHAGSAKLVLEVITADPDHDIPSSATALAGMGWA